MTFSTRLGRLFGIDVYLHWSFVLIPLLITVSALGSGAGVAGVAQSLMFASAVFGFIVMHEYGHALTARAFGIQTRDIVLLPIGGLARLEGMPRNPWHELWIALAGPAVNLAVIALLAPLLAWVVPMETWLAPSLGTLSGFMVSLVYANVLLGGFNLLPAFPMDGGRVLRAILALFRPYDNATLIAVRVGQAVAVLLGLCGLMSGSVIGLFLIAVFVFFAAETELRAVRAVHQRPDWDYLRPQDEVLGYRVPGPQEDARRSRHASQRTPATELEGVSRAALHQDRPMSIRLPNGAVVIVQGFRWRGK